MRHFGLQQYLSGGTALRRWLSAAILSLVASVAVSPARAQTSLAGNNVNMVSGTDWTTGDPFLQRQNEPSMAVSTRNNLHLLAGNFQDCW